MRADERMERHDLPIMISFYAQVGVPDSQPLSKLGQA